VVGGSRSNRPRVFLFHWNLAEAEERAGRLRALGYDVELEAEDGAAGGRKIRQCPPAAVVLDLSRLPSHGRSTALALRSSKPTRGVPLVFVGGAEEKVRALQEALPDATYTTWARIGSDLTRAIRNPPASPVVPKAPDYSGTPLPKKLGVATGSIVSLVGAPPDFHKTLLPLPDGVELCARATKGSDVIVYFATSAPVLDARFPRLAALLAEKGGLWIAWPKKASGVETDLSEMAVRKIGLRHGLVDVKVCAIDATWSGLRFMRRKG
jgi:hypothetical protein